MSTMMSLLSSLLQNQVDVQVSRGIKGLGLYAVVSLFLLTAYVFALVALAFFLVERMSPWVAMAAIALGFLLLGGAVFLAGNLSRQADKRQAEAVAEARKEARDEVLSSLTGGGTRSALVLAAMVGLAASGLFGKDEDGED